MIGAAVGPVLPQRAAVTAPECGRFLLTAEGKRTDPDFPDTKATGRTGLDEAEDVIRVNTELVVAEFDVRDKKGKRVPGLASTDFELLEDGTPQDIEVFSYGKASAKIARSIILIIDYSQSQTPYIETSIEAAKTLVDMLEPNDRLAIVTDDVQLLSNFTSDKTHLKLQLDGLKKKALAGSFGRSRQFSALYASVSELFEAEDKRPIVILQTDGDEFAELSLWGRQLRKGPCERAVFSFAHLQDLLEKAGTTIYSIIPGASMKTNDDDELISRARASLEVILKNDADKIKNSGISERIYSKRALKNWAKRRQRDADAVEQISALTGGISQYLETPLQAAEVYQRILDEMNQRYLIGFYPQNKARDGRKRSLKVNLRSGARYSIIGRSSYTPREN